MSCRVFVNVVRCWVEGAKRCRARCMPGTKGIEPGDSFFVEWRDPSGRRKMQRITELGRPGKKLADERAAQLRDQLTLGTYDDRSREAWGEFRKRFEAEGMAGLRPESFRVMKDSLDHVERILKPLAVQEIDCRAIDRFKARRLAERGMAPGSTLSPASLNKDLRAIKRALRTAERWGYIQKTPHITFARLDFELPRIITPADFATIYEECKSATLPAKLGCDPADWWRALLFTAYTTGWRIGELLTLRREDVDFATCEVSLRASNTKGRKAARCFLLPETIEHLRKIQGWGDVVFDWPHDKRTLYSEFARIQTAAGIKVECRIDHVHDAGCHRYAFHDLRRGFASLNATRLTATELQKLMRHQSFATTLGYINLADAMKSASDKVFRPAVS